MGNAEAKTSKEPKWQSPVKRIDFEKNFMLCEKPFGGKTEPRKYYFHDTLSVARYEVFEDLEMLVAKGRSYADILRSEKKIHEYLNKGLIVDAGIENYNSMELVKQKIERRFHPAMQLVALYVNLEDEDITKYDEVMMNKKMEDWKNEGFAMNDFFSLAFSLLEGFLESYTEISQGSLEKPKSGSQSKKPEQKDESGGARS
jgi:hypothetical protein